LLLALYEKTGFYLTMLYIDPPFDLLKHLKNATAALHAFLDTHLPLSAANPTSIDYGEHLYLLARWYQVLNAMLAANADLEIRQCVLANEQALDLIQHDLKALADSRLPVFDYGIDADSAITQAYFWGIEYVIKGSALGAKFLYKKLLNSSLPVTLHFFQYAAAQGGQEWLEFSKKIHSQSLQKIDIAQAEQGAVWAFEKIIELKRDLIRT
jgi:heme oxygenase